MSSASTTGRCSRKLTQINQAAALRMNGMSATSISIELGLPRARVLELLEHSDSPLREKKKLTTRKCLRCRSVFKPPHAGRFICGECHKTIARMS